MRRVWVTGAAGLLGAELMPYLAARGWQASAAPGRVRDQQPVDLTDATSLWRELDSVKPDVILNLAALTDVDYCEAHPQEAYRVNAGLVLGIAQWIAARGNGARLVHISTDQVYDGAGPHDESRVSPMNYYAYSKCLAESYVAQVGGTSLRSNFFGRSRVPKRASFSDWIVNSLRAQRDITVFDDALFSPLSLPTLVAAIECTLLEPVAGTFNLGALGGISKADFAFRLATAAGLPLERLQRRSMDSMARAARRPRDMRMNSDRFFEVFGGERAELTTEIDRVGGEYRNEAS